MKNIKTAWLWLREHGKYRRLVMVSVWLLLSIYLVLGALMAPHVSNIDDTPMNQYIEFSGNDPASIRMTSKQYNVKKERLVLKLNVQSSTDDPDLQVIDNDLKFEGETLNQTNAIVKVVPTTTNNFVVIVDNLSSKFGALKLTINNETPQTTAGGQAQKGGKVSFIVNENKKIEDSKLPQLTREQYAEEAINSQLDDENKLQNKKETIIKQANAAIEADTEKIDVLKKDIKYQTPAEKEQSNSAISNLKSDQSDNRETIREANKSIENSNTRISLLKEKQNAILNGTYKLPNPSKTVRLK